MPPTTGTAATSMAATSTACAAACRLTAPAQTHPSGCYYSAQHNHTPIVPTRQATHSRSADLCRHTPLLQVPPGCARYTLRLRKPLGMVLEEERGTGRITVAELVPGGAAARR